MKIEIEHKFLVYPNLIPFRRASVRLIHAGYFSVEPSIRVTLNSEGVGRTCFKLGTDPVAGRFELEHVIDAASAQRLLNTAPFRIVKARWSLDGWDIDQFLGDHEGLWLAEWETDTKQPVPAVPWLGANVSADPRYNNAWIAFNGVPR